MEPFTGEDAPNIAATELKSFDERFRAMESKMNLVDTMFGIHESTVEAAKYGDMDPAVSVYWRREGEKYTQHLDFYRDAMFFMKRIRESHQRLIRFEQQRKEKAEAELKARNSRAPESETTKEISTKAFLKGEQAKVMQVDWDVFASKKGDIEKSIMTPIEVISETEQEIKSGAIAPGRKSLANAAKSRFLKTNWLADLEKRFENYDGTESKQVPAEGTVTVLAENLSPESANEEKKTEKGHNLPGEKSGARDDDFDDDASINGHEVEEPDTLSLATSITSLLHLRCLMHFIDTEIEPKREYVNSKECTRIHFHDLWHLFKPGDKIINQEEKQVFVVLRVQIPRHKVEEPWERWNRRVIDDSDSDSDVERDENDNPFTLSCAYIDFDGKAFGPVAIKFKISPFGELKQIRSLPVYPLRFAKDTQSRQNIAKRGQMLLDVAKFKAMYYMGVTLDKRDEIDSQVVIDFNEALADEDRRKAWEPKIAPVSTAPDARGDDTCMALCCIHQVVREGFLVDSKMTEDYVKTLVPDTSLQAPSLILSPRSLEDTLNSVDELTETEFLVMTYRDLGTTAKEVETELEKNFALASRWGCILLLDEADVFLSARERMDFNRNGLVAVFLRVLEYYAGILFLTTNRIGDFDEAFASRIHMSLHYPELDEQKTLKVFRLNLELIEQRFQKQGRTILFDPSSVEDFAQQHFREHKYHRWNGRQIRNACQTALALAEFDAQGGALEIDGQVDKNAVVKLQLKYFKTVQRAYLDFGKYLGDIQGAQGDRRAIDYKLLAPSIS
ncbi:hypothetical protein EsH8_V_000986 [Colletotrichum jinshuiense]